MKAIVMHEYGDESVLKYEEAEKPKPQADEVLIKVKIAAVNPVDWKIRDGLGKQFEMKLPTIPGCEASGTIEEVGAKVNSFKAGDEVFSYFGTYEGGYAEYVAVKENAIGKKPVGIDFENAAAIAVGALTAWQAIFDQGKLNGGQKILIHGAAGGVGSMAVQLAKWKGVYVYATASGANEDFVESLGADEFIDYQTAKFEDIVKDVDIVFDCVGGDTQERSFQVLKKGGFLISSVSPPPEEMAKKFEVTAEMMSVKPNADELKQIIRIVESGKLKTRVEKVFPLAEAAAAQKLSRAGHVAGKIVLKIESD